MGIRDSIKSKRPPMATESVSTTLQQLATAERFEREYSYSYSYSPLEKVLADMKALAPELSSAIVAFDFTNAYKWTDDHIPFINTLGRAMYRSGDKCLPLGFGDVPGESVPFSFRCRENDDAYFDSIKEVVDCYRKIVQKAPLSGSTSYASTIDVAVDIVKENGGQFQPLVLVADSQVTKSFFNPWDGELSAGGQKTMESIVNASEYPLPITFVGVGEGSWEHMKKFQDKIPARKFDNFQFVNYTEVISKDGTLSEKEEAFALALLKKFPSQYKATKDLGIIGRVTGRPKKVTLRPPPIPYTSCGVPTCVASTSAPVIKT